MTVTEQIDAPAQPGRHFAALLEDGRIGVYDEQLHEHGVFDRYEEAFAALAALDRDTFADAQGPEFTIPILIPEGIESRDGRMCAEGSLYWRDDIGPWPLNWQFVDQPGHMGAAPVGTITAFERTPRGIAAVGRLGTWPAAQQAAELIDSGAMHFVSGMVVNADVSEMPMGAIDPESGEAERYVARVDRGELVGATGVIVPAFAEATITLVETAAQPSLLPVAAAAVDGRFPTRAPKAWFENPRLPGPTPLTVTDVGRVFGHVGPRVDPLHKGPVCHIGMSGNCTKAPPSGAAYAYFLTGEHVTAEGEKIRIGTITAEGGHAPMRGVSPQAAAAHYDDTRSAAAYVNVGEDEFGIWAAGMVKPDITETQLCNLRAAKPSGDWRPIAGYNELVAVLCVNTPGFPTPRVAIAASGAVESITGLPAPRRTDPGVLPEELRVVFDAQQQRFAGLVASLESRLELSERVTLPLVASATRERIATHRATEVEMAPLDADRLAAGIAKGVRDGTPEILAAVEKILALAQLKTGTINDLPDSAFAYIEPGGKKDADGKTTPRSKRHFPVHDEAHTRNALARAPQSPYGKQAMPKICSAAKKFGIKAEACN